MDVLYTNFDHTLDEAVVNDVMTNPGKVGQHAARDFCGYVTYEDGVWIEEVWRYGVLVQKMSSGDIRELVRWVNDEYGYG